jgi:hypothetical protein
MAKEKKGLKRTLINAGSWKIAKRVGKSIPYVGTFVAIGFIGYDIRRKGIVRGVLNSGLDAIPFVGAGKNIVEFFTGDLLPDKNPNGNKKI